jgi:hypothetical protein
MVRDGWCCEKNALPARSSRPSQGEVEITLRLCFGEGEFGFLTLPQGGSLRRNDEAGRGGTVFILWSSMVRDGWCCEKNALPARSSRPSQGEGEICLRLCFGEGEIGLGHCRDRRLGSLLDPSWVTERLDDCHLAAK